jgi:predicted nucleic acid-binding protein
MVAPKAKLSVVSDPDDNKFFQCALDGGAHYSVSGDATIQAVKNYQEIQVLTSNMFLAVLTHLEK